MIEARLPDGTILRFPEGTADDVIDRAVQQHLGGAQSPTQESGVGAWLGRRARDVVEGLSGFPSAAIEAAIPGRAGLRAMMPTEVARRHVPTLAEAASGAADAAGLPRPQTDAERMTSAVVQGVVGALPTLGVGGGGLPAIASQLVGGGAGGAAAEAARQGGYGEAGQIAAGLVGGVGGAAATQAAAAGLRGLGGAVAPFTQGGRERVVADTILRNSSDPQNLRARIAASVDDSDARLPGSPVTTAVAARDPRLLAVESSIRDGAMGPDMAAPLREAQFQRGQVQAGALAAMDDGRTPAERGAATRTGLRSAEQARRAAVSRAYQAIDPDGTSRLPTAPLQAARDAEMTGRWGPGAGAMPAPLAGLFDDITAAGDAQPWEVMQRLRSRAAALAGDPSLDDRGRASARAVVGAIDQSAQDAATAGGFTAEQAQRWQNASALRRRLGEDFATDTTGANASGRILATADYGAPRMSDEAVPRTALANVSSVRQVLRAAGNAPEVREALRGQFIADLTERVTQHSMRVGADGQAGRPMSAAAWDRVWQQRAPIARELFDGPTMRRLELLARDFSEVSIAANAGRSAGSQTAQNLSVGGMIARATNGLVDPNMPAAQTLFSAGGIMRLLYQAPEAATRELLAQAMADPRFAAMLLARASPNATRRAAAYIEQNMAQRLTEAAGTAGFRQTVRSAGEQQRRQAQQPQ